MYLPSLNSIGNIFNWVDRVYRTYLVGESVAEIYNTYNDEKITSDKRWSIITVEALFAIAQSGELISGSTRKMHELPNKINVACGLSDILRQGVKGYLTANAEEPFWKCLKKVGITACYRFGPSVIPENYTKCDAGFELLKVGSKLWIMATGISPYVTALLRANPKIIEPEAMDKELAKLSQQMQNLDTLDEIPQAIYEQNVRFFRTIACCAHTGKPIRWAVKEEGSTQIFFEKKSIESALSAFKRDQPHAKPKGWKGDLDLKLIVPEDHLQQRIDDILKFHQKDLK